MRIFLSVALMLAFLWAMQRGGFPLVPDAEAIRRTNFPLLVVSVAATVAMHVVRALRWRHLLYPISPNLSSRRVLAASWIGFTAILLLPLRMGEFVRPWLIRDDKQLTITKSLGTIGAERVIDGVMLTSVLATVLLFVKRLDPLPSKVGNLDIPVAAIPRLGFVVLGLFLCLFVAMALFYFARSFARGLVMGTVGLLNKGFAERMTHIVEGVADGLHFLGALRYSVPFVVESVVYHLLNVISMWSIGVACGLPLTFGQACAVMGVIAVGILVPAGPGLFGAYQLSAFGALAMFYPPDVVLREGSLFVFMMYVTMFVWHIIAAIIGGILDPAMVRNTQSSLTAGVPQPAAEASN